MVNHLGDFGGKLRRICRARTGDLNQHRFADPLRVFSQQAFESLKLSSTETLSARLKVIKSRLDLWHNAFRWVQLIATDDNLLILVQLAQSCNLRLDARLRAILLNSVGVNANRTVVDLRGRPSKLDVSSGCGLAAHDAHAGREEVTAVRMCLEAAEIGTQ